MNRRWGKLPPMRERNLGDDLRWALFVLVGAALGYALFGAGDASVLLGAVVGVGVAVVVLNLLRRAGRRSR